MKCTRLLRALSRLSALIRSGAPQDKVRAALRGVR